MTNTWVTADPHFGHWGVCKFLREDGSKLRPWDDPDSMDDALIENWNSVVGLKDRIYVLGDLCINRRALPTISRCNGRKVLVKGNHDIFKLDEYTSYFDDIRAYVVMPNFKGTTKLIMSHIPIHSDSLGRFGYNVHGHLHDRALDDERYLCVSVERTNFKPVNLDVILG